MGQRLSHPLDQLQRCYSSSGMKSALGKRPVLGPLGTPWPPARNSWRGTPMALSASAIIYVILWRVVCTLACSCCKVRWLSVASPGRTTKSEMNWRSSDSPRTKCTVEGGGDRASLAGPKFMSYSWTWFSKARNCVRLSRAGQSACNCWAVCREVAMTWSSAFTS